MSSAASLAARNLNLETATNRIAVLATYRHLLRATRIAFDGKQQSQLFPTQVPLNNVHEPYTGDNSTLTASRTYARAEFLRGRTLKPMAASQAIEHAQGVTQILRENLVQGKNVGGEKYKLNIHEFTQRLDNDVAPSLKGTTKSFDQIKRDSLLGKGEIKLCGQ